MFEAECKSCPYYDATGQCKIGIYGEESILKLWNKLSFSFGYKSLAPYVPTPCRVIRQMLSLAELKAGEVVYDMGSGDGRIVMLAAGVFEAYATGVEQEEELVKKSLDKILELHLDKKAKIIGDDLLKAEIDKADVVTMYLSPGGNLKVKPKLERELRPGTRVVSLEFEIPGWKAHRVVQIVDEGLTYTIYLYRK